MDFPVLLESSKLIRQNTLQLFIFLPKLNKLCFNKFCSAIISFLWGIWQSCFTLLYPSTVPYACHFSSYPRYSTSVSFASHPFKIQTSPITLIFFCWRFIKPLTFRFPISPSPCCSPPKTYIRSQTFIC